jgi:nitrite reductase/ring-hydroxylating ferredoxin subunit
VESAAAQTTWRCAADALQPGQTNVFRLQRADGRSVSGFIVNHEGFHYAYVNRCPHAGTPLDLWPNEFFTEDGRRLICSTHGAVFVPDTGLCVQGPCPGARLEPLSLRKDGDLLVVTCPA